MSDMAERRDSAGDSTTARIRDYIHSQFPQARRRLQTDEDALLDTGVVDSLGILEIVDFLTETFRIDVTDEDLNPENFGSIAKLAAFVRTKTEP